MSGEPGTGDSSPVSQATPGWSKAMAEGIGSITHATDFVDHGVTRPLKQPVVDSYGSMTEQKDYQVGCHPQEVIDGDKGVVVIDLIDNGVRRVIKIGRTPEVFDPTKAGLNLQESGTPGEYLMGVQTIDPSKPAEKPTTRYVDKADIAGIVVKKGEPVRFNPNPQRGRQLAVIGTVQTVSRLR